MIVQDIVTRIRRTFGDEAAVQVTDADIIRWINDAQIEIVKKNDGALQKTGFVDLVANQSTYTMPTDLFIIRSLRYKFSDMLSYKSIAFKNMQELDDSIDGWDGSAYTTGSPAYFTVYENKALLFPTPDRAQVNGLKILYNQKPTDVTTLNDSLSLPLIYHNTVVTYCMWQASLLDEDHEVAIMYQGNLKDDIQLLQTRESQESTATYKTITVLEDDL
jgi:hypothetical protein